ncbi:MAG: hypothetical protein SFU57_04950 [Gemmatimonadales bacterium]|nr:hypothetical protein [Gemmatimonadales bacterium]
MTIRMRWLLSATSALVIVMTLYTTTAGVAAEATGSAAWCGVVSYGGSNWHRFGDGTDCRKNPHAEDQAGTCIVHDYGGAWGCGG